MAVQDLGAAVTLGSQGDEHDDLIAVVWAELVDERDDRDQAGPRAASLLVAGFQLRALDVQVHDREGRSCTGCPAASRALARSSSGTPAGQRADARAAQ